MAGMTKAVSSICPRFALVSGATASTNIAVSGITTDDELVYVLEHASAATMAGMITDRTSTTSITSDGYIQCTTATSDDMLEVLWIDKSA